MKDKQQYELRVNYNIDTVLEAVECHKNNPSYEVYKQQLLDLIDENIGFMTPLGYSLSSQLEGVKVVQCLVTLGKEIDDIIKHQFEIYNYLEAMMLNALADNILFEATNHLYEILKSKSEKVGKFLSSRFEPGNSEVPMLVQKTLFDNIVPIFELDLIITEGFMLAPAKSLVYYYQLTDEDCSLGIDHDCSSCASDCLHRKYIIRIHDGDTTNFIQGKIGENLLDVLRRHNIIVSAPCGGKKLCGKCKIIAQNHGYTMTEAERELLTQAELEADMILACFHTLDRDLNVYLHDKETHHEIETGFKAFDVLESKYTTKEEHVSYPMGIGVDIGTTTLAVSLVNMVTQEVIDIKKRLNPQKAFGADVISRIMYVNENKTSILSDMIKDAIQTMSYELLEDNKYNWKDVENMVISGNTTMIYLLLNINPMDLAIAPFRTIEASIKEYDSVELFNKVDSFNVTILPWISAYVGGDIISGLYGTHMLDESKNVVLVDIGTNGEMVLKAKDRMICAATAAGPAFEGANIKCGMGSVNGAICEIKATEDSYEVKTLGDSLPKGICGSALIDAVALMLKQGHVNASGYMEKEVSLYEEIKLYPEDIRQVQLAKAAIFAGVKILLDEMNLTFDDIDVFYVAGGFGSHINIDNSAYIGLIPKEVIDKVQVVGNTSLAGSIRYLLEKDGREEIKSLLAKSEYIELSTSMSFNMAYVEAMTFDIL